MTARLEACLVLQTVGGTLAFWACARLRARNKALLWEVGHICGKDREDAPNLAVPANHLNPTGTSHNERLQQHAHRFVKYTLRTRAHFLCCQFLVKNLVGW